MDQLRPFRDPFLNFTARPGSLIYTAFTYLPDHNKALMKHPVSSTTGPSETVRKRLSGLVPEGRFEAIPVLPHLRISTQSSGVRRINTPVATGAFVPITPLLGIPNAIKTQGTSGRLVRYQNSEIKWSPTLDTIPRLGYTRSRLGLGSDPFESDLCQE